MDQQVFTDKLTDDMEFYKQNGGQRASKDELKNRESLWKSWLVKDFLWLGSLNIRAKGKESQ